MRTRGRNHTTTQMKIIAELCPKLDRVPYLGNRRLATTPLERLGNLRRTGSRIRRRIADHRGAPDLGAPNVAEVLMHDDAVRGAVETVACTMSLSRKTLHRMIAAPAASERELGTLLTAAWADEAKQAVARNLWATKSITRLAA